MKEENTRNDYLSHKNTINDLKEKLYEELNRLKGIMAGESSYIEKNNDIKNYFVSLNETLTTDQPVSFQSPQLTKKDLSKGTQLKKRVCDALIWKTAENYYKMLNNPTYKKEYLKFLNLFQKTIIDKFKDIFFEGKNLNKELSELLKEEFNKLKNRFIETFKLKEESIKFSSSHYSSKKQYLNALNQIPKKIRKTIEKDIKNLLEEGSNIFRIRKEIISKIASYAKGTDLQNAIKERYRIFKEIFPKKEDYIDFNLKGWKINNRFANIIKKILVEDEETKIIYDIAFQMILESNETIIRDFANLEAENIYNP